MGGRFRLDDVGSVFRRPVGKTFDRRGDLPDQFFGTCGRRAGEFCQNPIVSP